MNKIETGTASIGWRCWVRWYLRAVVWFARATGMERQRRGSR